MLASDLESFRFEFFMIGAPLILEVMKFVNVGDHHVISEDSNSSDILGFSYLETGTKGDCGLNS